MDETNARPDQISVSYDKNTDTFYMYLCDEPRKSIIRDTGNGILIQLDAETKQPIGAVIHNFETRFSKNNQGKPALSIPLARPFAHA